MRMLRNDCITFSRSEFTLNSVIAYDWWIRCTKSITNKATERTTDLIDQTQEHLDRLDERTEALAAAATKALKKTGSTIKDSVVGPFAKRAADAVAGALADHYPVVRRAFLAAAAEPFAAITDHDESQAAHQR